MVSTLAPLFAAAKLGRSFLSALTGQAFLGNGHSPSPPASGRLRLLLVLGFVLAAILTPLTSVFPGTLTTLDAEAYGAPPGFLNADLPRYLAQQKGARGSLRASRGAALPEMTGMITRS